MLVLLISTLLFFIANRTNLVNTLNNAYFDLQSSFSASSHILTNNNIVVIAIDETSLATLEPVVGKWPWPRSIHAELIEVLFKHDVNAIAYDVLFIEKDLYRPDDDAYFQQTIAEYKNTFLAGLLLDTQTSTHSDQIERLLFPKAFAGNSQIGLINANLDDDGVVRRHQAIYHYKNAQYRSLPARLANIDLAFPNKVTLNWQTNHATPYITHSFSDVFKAIVENDLTYLAQFKDKTVFIGATANGLYDSINTPIHTNLAGIYVLASAYDNLTNQVYFSELEEPNLYILALLGCLILIMFGVLFQNDRTNVLATTITFIVLHASLVGVSTYLFGARLLIGTATISLSWCITFVTITSLLVISELNKKRRIQQLFGRFVDPKVVSQLLAEDNTLTNINGTKCFCTVLFSDIRGFTTLSETHTPEQIFTLLNQYFSNQVDVVFRYQGTLDKFIGDCIMAFWGAPLSQQVQAVQALECALAMEQSLHKFKSTLSADFNAFDIGIGLHFGEVLAGFVGTEKRVDYTVLGDTVNLASRIEGLTKDHDRILLSEETIRQINALTQRYEFIKVGEFQVKGRKQTVTLYTVKREIK